MTRSAMTRAAIPAPRARTPILLDALSAALLLGALAVMVWPVNGRVAPRSAVATVQALPATPTPVIAAPASMDAFVQTVVDHDVFSATRRAPRARFALPGQMSEAAAIPGDAAVNTGSADAADITYPRLTGIVGAASDRRALLQLTESDGAPRLFRAGEGASGYRIARIDADRVLLTSRSGTRVVRLAPRVTPDSLENLP